MVIGGFTVQLERYPMIISAQTNKIEIAKLFVISLLGFPITTILVIYLIIFFDKVLSNQR